jgi:hypothetical protein
MDHRNNNLVFEELAHNLSHKKNCKYVPGVIGSPNHTGSHVKSWIPVASFEMCAVEVTAKKTDAIIIFEL